MRMRALRIASWTVIAAFAGTNAIAAERVARFRQITVSGNEVSSPIVFLGRNETEQLMVSFFFNQNPAPLVQQEFARTTFTVYRTEEVDERLATERRTTDASLAATERSVEAKMTNFETALRADVVRSLDAIPQRVLAHEAGEAIKAAVIEQFRQELAQLREELKAEIRALQMRRDE